MQTTDTLTMLYRHNLWANLKILEQCATLSDKQLDSSMSGVFGTIRETLQHIVGAEQSYFSRISTGQQLNRQNNPVPTTFTDMEQSLRTTGAGFIEWAPKVQATDTVQIDWDGTMRAVPKTVILTQIINHATEHRAQIMAMLTQLGIQPLDLDGWSYFDQLSPL